MQWEKVVETKICKHCQTSFLITDKDLEFYQKVSPIFNWVKYPIPAPTLCPDCRQQRRASWRNEFKYYSRKCDKCEKNLISVHNHLVNFPVFCQKCWWWDNDSDLNYWRDFDFTRPFFEQFNDLQNNVPKISMINDDWINSENSEYCYNFSYWKNNYLITTAWHAEDSMYCQYWWYFKYNIDCNLIFNSEIAYECMWWGNIYNCFFVQDSNDCNNCFLWIDLKWCSDCFWCIGLRNKKYHIFNKKYTEIDYKIKIKDYFQWSYNKLQTLKKEFYDFSLKYPHIATHQNNCTNCIGDRLNNCKNVLGNNIYSWENCKYYWWGADNPRTSYDILIWWNHDLWYESIVPDNTYQACFTNYCFKSKFVFYSDNCFNCLNIFWCIWLRDKSYCILNKQYSKEQYEELVPKIIEHMKKTWEWWEFFPSSISPFWYNETVAMEYFPISNEKALKEDFNWSTYEVPFPKVSKIIPASKLPDNISDIPEDILNRAIECEVTKKPFKIIAQELEFYRKHNLPVPRRHPNQRHLDRMTLRNPRKLFTRICDKCSIDIETTYSLDKSEIVYCEECYNKEVY